jgi:hypothetical protein
VTIGLSWRCERLSLLHNIGDKISGLGVAWLAARMGRFGRYLEAITGFDRAGRLTLNGKPEAAFQHVGGFDSRVRVSPDRGRKLGGWQSGFVSSHASGGGWVSAYAGDRVGLGRGLMRY